MRRLLLAAFALALAVSPVRAQEYAYGVSGGLFGGLFAELLVEYTDGRTQQITVFDQGRYNANGSHSTSNLNYLTGELSGLGYNSFFAFDFQLLEAEIFSAALRINTEAVQGTPTINFFHFGGDIGALVNGTGGTTAYGQLGSGVFVGQRSYTSADSDTWQNIDLNAAGLDAIASSGGYVAFGGTTAPVEVVPEPISMVLLGSGLFGVGAAARRRRQAGELPAA